MAKAAEAFRTISEVADELDVQKHVLRFWEQRFPQIKPMKRGGGRRYYRPEDLELLRGIRHLLHAEGYTIKGVQKILRETGIDTVKAAGRRALAAADGSRRRGRNARAPAALIEPTAIANTAAPAAKTPIVGNRREVLQAAIVELESCRRLLRGEPGPAVVEGPAKRAPTRARRKGA